jgi:hypothetical protein
MDRSKLRPMTADERASWEESLAEHSAERADIDATMDAFRSAADEDSFSGHLRKAIHQSRVPLRSLCQEAGIDWESLRAFLAGEELLPTAVLDRLAPVLQIDVVSSQVD